MLAAAARRHRPGGGCAAIGIQVTGSMVRCAMLLGESCTGWCVMRVSMYGCVCVGSRMQGHSTAASHATDHALALASRLEGAQARVAQLTAQVAEMGAGREQGSGTSKAQGPDTTDGTGGGGGVAGKDGGQGGGVVAPDERRREGAGGGGATAPQLPPTSLPPPAASPAATTTGVSLPAAGPASAPATAPGSSQSGAGEVGALRARVAALQRVVAVQEAELARLGRYGGCMGVARRALLLFKLLSVCSPGAAQSWGKACGHLPADTAVFDECAVSSWHDSFSMAWP